MRLDKFLKTAIIFKTRSSGEKAIEDGKVLLNELKSKPSANIKEGDLLTVILPFKITKYRVLKLLDKNVSKKDAKNMIEIIGEEKIELF